MSINYLSLVRSDLRTRGYEIIMWIVSTFIRRLAVNKKIKPGQEVSNKTRNRVAERMITEGTGHGQVMRDRRKRRPLEQNKSWQREQESDNIDD